METENVVISEERYKELIECEIKLNLLEAYGVDNWGGYGLAMSDYWDEDDE